MKFCLMVTEVIRGHSEQLGVLLQTEMSGTGIIILASSHGITRKLVMQTIHQRENEP